jgi:two-component system, NarL family, sensor kinase
MAVVQRDVESLGWGTVHSSRLSLANDTEPALGVRHFLARFLLGSVAALLVVTATTLYFSRSRGLNHAVAEANHSGWLVATTFGQPQITNAIVAREPAALDAFDELVHRYVLGGDIVRVKIWDQTGLIVYSDEQRLIGQRFQLGDGERAVLAGGETEAELSDLKKPENQYEAPSVKLLEVYSKIVAPDGQPLLFEAYFLYDTVVKAGTQAWRDLLPISAASLLALELTQIPLVFQLARRLRRGQVQREHLLRQAVESSAIERRRIAADLHDGVVQDLSGVSYSLAAMARRSDANDTRTGALADTAEQVRAAVQGLRSLLVEIHPPNLASEGLASAMEALATRLTSHGIRPVVEIDSPTDLNEGVAALLYRGAQEAMRNIISHSRAKEVHVLLSVKDGVARLSIEDDGVGFDPMAVNEPAIDGHVGLRLLADLTAEMGGSVVLESARGSGTRFLMSLPVA